MDSEVGMGDNRDVQGQDIPASQTPPSRNVTKRFLFSRACDFLNQQSVRSNAGQILVPRKERRKAARDMAARVIKMIHKEKRENAAQGESNEN
jgi:hypothetical protein